MKQFTITASNTWNCPRIYQAATGLIITANLACWCVLQQSAPDSAGINSAPRSSESTSKSGKQLRIPPHGAFGRELRRSDDRDTLVEKSGKVDSITMSHHGQNHESVYHFAHDVSVLSPEDRSADLGRLNVGVRPRHSFRVRNTSGQAFAITGIKKTCSCDNTDVQIGSIVPADEALNLTYELSSTGGSKYGQLLVSTNSPADEFKQLTFELNAFIPRTIWATPKELRFACKLGATARLKLRFDSDVKDFFHHSIEITTLRNLIDITLLERGDDFLIIETAISASIESGTFHDLLIVNVDAPDHAALTVMVSAEPEGPI